MNADNCFVCDDFDEGALLRANGLELDRAELVPETNRVRMVFRDDGRASQIINAHRLGRERVESQAFARALKWARRAILSTRDGATTGGRGR